MSLKNSHNPDKELNDEDRLNNDGDIKYLKSLLTKDDKIVFGKVHKVFRDLSDNGDLIFLSFILKISKPENIEFYNKFLKNKGFGKESLDKVIGYVTDNIEKVLENKKKTEPEKKVFKKTKIEKGLENDLQDRLKSIYNNYNADNNESIMYGILKGQGKEFDRFFEIVNFLLEKIETVDKKKEFEKIIKIFNNISEFKGGSARKGNNLFTPRQAVQNKKDQFKSVFDTKYREFKSMNSKIKPTAYMKKINSKQFYN